MNAKTSPKKKTVARKIAKRPVAAKPARAKAPAEAPAADAPKFTRPKCLALAIGSRACACGRDGCHPSDIRAAE